MALHFDSGADAVLHGSDASIDNLDSQTWIWWGQQTVGTNTGRRIVYKGGNLQVFVQDPASPSAANGVRYFRARATTASDASSNTTIFTNGVPAFVAIFDSDGVAPEIWTGDLNTRATEVPSYGAQATGVGTPTSDASSTLEIGTRLGGSLHSDWHISYLWVYNRRLSVAEALSHQFQPWRINSGCVLKAAYFDDTTLADLSGNGNNGTINGTPVLRDHVPLGPPFAFRGLFAPAPGPVCVAGTDKRRSSMFPVPGLVMLPCPDGSISDLDRRQIQWMFPIISGVVSKTIITDLAALLQKQDQLLTTDLGGALQKQDLERTVSLAAVIQLAGITISADLDAKLKAVAILRTTDLDAAIQSPNLLRTVLLDAILAATVQLTVSTDAILKAIGVTRTTDLDAALVLLGQLKTLSMDAAIQLANLTVTTDLDAKLRALAITSITDLDSVLKATGVTETVLLDAILKAIGVTRTTDLDAALVLLNITSITDLDAILKIVGALETTDLDAALQVVALTRTTDLDAILKALGVTATTDLDAIVKIVGALATTDLDAAIQALGQTETADLDAVITGAAPVTIITDLDAKLRALGLLKSANLDAAIQLAGVTRITDLDAALLSSETIETALDALLFAAGVTVTTALDARITGIATRLIATSLDAHLGFPTTELGIKPSWLGSVGQRMWVKYYAPFRTLDTFPPLGTPNVTLSARVDAILQEPGATLASSLDAMIALVAVQQSVNLDSVLSDDPGMRTENVSLDAALGLVALTLATSLDTSVMAFGQLETAALDATLTLQPLLTTDLDGSLLLENLTLSASLDASLQSGTTPLAPSNLVATEI